MALQVNEVSSTTVGFEDDLTPTPEDAPLQHEEVGSSGVLDPAEFERLRAENRWLWGARLAAEQVAELTPSESDTELDTERESDSD